MPRATRVLSLNLGSQAISMAEFRPRTGGGLVLHEYKRRDVAIESAVEEAGLWPVVIGVATMGLYNAFRYNYSDVTEPSLLIDIGARTTNLLFIEPGKIFSRSVPIGGSLVTAAVAKEFNEPFATAESRKRESGFVSLGGAYADPSDADVARMSKIIRSTMTRLHAEIMVDQP